MVPPSVHAYNTGHMLWQGDGHGTVRCPDKQTKYTTVTHCLCHVIQPVGLVLNADWLKTAFQPVSIQQVTTS